MHASWLNTQQQALDAQQQRVADLEQRLQNARQSSTEVNLSPADLRKELLERFPAGDSLNQSLAQILTMAAAHGLQLQSGDYRLLPAKAGLFDRYVINLPLKGEYLKLRRFIEALHNEVFALAVEDVALRREAIANDVVEAQIRLVLISRRVNE
jgi:hypothetical protein